MPKPAGARAKRRSRTKRSESRIQAGTQQIPSDEAIKAGEQIAMAAFASGLKLAAAFGTVAAKTASLALSSLATGADKFSELVKEEALRSYKAQLDSQEKSRPKESPSGQRRAYRKKTGR